MPSSPAPALIKASRALASAVDVLRFAPPVSHVYNPLKYAWQPHAEYLARYGTSAPREVMFLGMNPGPWGMAQTGVPFGEIGLVRDWLGIHGPVNKPLNEHPKRPVQGFDCHRSEVSGARLWGWAKARFGSPEAFFQRFFIANYCPLVFMEDSGRNRTPDKLPTAEREALYAPCDAALRQMVAVLRPTWVIGVGAFAAGRAQAALAGVPVRIGRILHPSPASPKANADWAGAAEAQLTALGIRIS